MIALGIDPGIERTGIGIVELTGSKLKLIYHHLILTSAKDSDPARIKIIYDELNSIIKNFKIDLAVIEKLFFAKNVKTAMRVSEVRGAILLALEYNNLKIHELTPIQVKQGLIGYGRGTKTQVQELVRIILNLSEKLKQDDVADGIACAIVGLNTFRTLSKMKR